MMRTRPLALYLIFALAWPPPADALRPLNAGQEESAVAQLTRTLAPAEFSRSGLEESPDAQRRNPSSFRQYLKHMPLLEAWGYRAFLSDYQTQVGAAELLESPVITWGFAERDMEKWLRGQAPTVVQLKEWAERKWIRPVWPGDGQERTPVDFAATVAFQEPHHLAKIASALSQRNALVNDILETSVGLAILRRLIVLSHLSQAMVPWPVSNAPPVAVAPILLHRVIGWWQHLHRHSLDQPIAREVMERIAQHTLTMISEVGHIPQFEGDEATLDAYLYLIARTVPEAGLEEWPAPEAAVVPSAVEVRSSVGVGA